MGMVTPHYAMIAYISFMLYSYIQCVLLLGAIYQFGQSINCAAHYVNPHSAQQFINCANSWYVNTSIMSKEEHRLIFEKFCRERNVDKSRRTISEEKAKRIRQAVMGEYSGVTASFRHWVNRTKKFELLNCAELELTELMLCLPVKTKVSKSRKLHLHACHTGSVHG